MGGWSKLHPEITTLKCSEFAHPWTDSCVLATGYTFIDSCVGSAGFFALLYSLQYVSTVLKKKKKVKWKDLLKTYMRSTVFAASISAGTFGIQCILRRFLGKYTYYTMVFIPASIAGLAIHLEGQKGRELFVNAFANCAIELWIRFLEHSKILNWNSNTQTITFMFLSSFLSYLLSRTSFNTNYFWFFIPPKVQEKNMEQVCFHKEDCKKHNWNLFVMYSTTGLALQFIRLFVNNINNPKLFLFSLARPKIFKLAAVLGGYVVIYQTIRCYLYQKQQKHSPTHDMLAGFLAGAAFRFQPTIQIFNSALITIIQILTEVGYYSKTIPNIPYLDLTFSFLCGVLFHSRILTKDCPQLMVYIMSKVTHGLSDRVFLDYNRFLKNIAMNLPVTFKKTR